MTKIVLSHFSESFRQLIEYEFNEQNATNSMTILFWSTVHTGQIAINKKSNQAMNKL